MGALQVEGSAKAVGNTRDRSQDEADRDDDHVQKPKQQGLQDGEQQDHCLQLVGDFSEQ